jgi:hypothetical protein
VSESISQSQWKCLLTPGGQGSVSFAVVRVYQSGGHVDPNGPPTIKTARAAGIGSVDGYIFPCISCGNPGGQVNATKSFLDAQGATYGRLW